MSIEETACRDDLDGVTCQGTLLALDHLRDSGNEDGGGDVARVAAAFPALGADDVGAHVEAFGNVLGVSDHVHVEDAGGVEAADDMGGRDADGGDEEFGARVDDDGDEFVELAFCVVVAFRWGGLFGSAGAYCKIYVMYVWMLRLQLGYIGRGRERERRI